MAFTSSIVSCSSKEMGSDIWNLYSGNHPDLHDNFMDPPERIMVHPTKNTSSRCATDKNSDCFDVYYGTQSIIQNPYTTSAVMEVQSHCKFTIEEFCDINGNAKPKAGQRNCHSTKDSTKHSKSKEHSSKHQLAVPTNFSDLRRNKSDSDISSLDDIEPAPQGRARNLSDGSVHQKSRCVCKCTCGYVGGSLADVRSKDEHCHKSHSKSRHKSRSLKSFLHGILS